MNSRKQALIFSSENYGRSNSNQRNTNLKTSQNSEIPLEEAVEDFTLMGKVDGRSEKTLNLYDYVLKNFLEHCGEDTLIGEIQPNSIRKYLAELMDEGLKNTSVAIHHRVLNAFFNWLIEEGKLAESPTRNIDEPNTPNKFPKVLDSEQIEELLYTAKNWRRTWAGYRNFTIIVTFLDTGLRLNELVNAKLEDLDLKQRSIKVHGKGAKDRKVYFGKRNYKCLKRWLKLREDKGNIWDDTIFISQNGDKLKKRHVQRVITRIQREADLEDVQVSPHVLRHTAATLAVQNGLDPFSLKRQFGWEQMRTALRYVHMSDKALQESYRHSSPMDNLES
ncbi:MAG: tyrosine-type recombinase/integrase [Candidatus Bipolaricaulota bacterium]|nr:tyrosine-type recombinase/integrase [Candidatus Bipolaricaulota bacterium]